MKGRFCPPRVYPILDAGLLRGAGIAIEDFARMLYEAGIRFLQYRDKDATDAEVQQRARVIREIFPVRQTTLILNDRAHLFAASGFDGLHVGQDDLSPGRAREIVGTGAVLGMSTHNDAQVERAAGEPVDYIAVGPVFGTQSKLNPDPVVGLEGVRSARLRTAKPLVAIGGIMLGNSASVFDAGADSIAIISALVPKAVKEGGKVVEDFLARIG
jgi:thiamine-phosphate pyrophosphorylase